jgi:hypothetical protein
MYLLYYLSLRDLLPWVKPSNTRNYAEAHQLEDGKSEGAMRLLLQFGLAWLGQRRELFYLMSLMGGKKET